MFGIYVHWPFCQARCPYCDFNAHVWREIDQPEWRDALLAELDYAAASFDRAPVDAVFFGGGTPSLMPPATAGAILDRIGERWGYVTEPEITLEANPNSAEAEKFRAYASAGVNRISVGVQSLRDDVLRMLGRIHSAAEALAAIRLAAEAVPRVSFDLITARPGQTLAAWRGEFAEALATGVGHLSVYQLTIEPGTPFAKLQDCGRLVLPSADRAAAIYETTVGMAEAAGLVAYEISNFARPGLESRHNLIYWRGGDWIGIGPGAHGRPRREGVRVATETLRDPAGWLETVRARGHGLLDDSEPLAGAGQASEYLMMALRLAEGASLARYREFGGPALAEDHLSVLAEEGLLTVSGDRLATTPRGRLVLDGLLRELLA